jgi:hypothetical protein
MTTQTITLDLPLSVVQRANKMAQTLHRPLEEILALTLSQTLPDVEDAPPEMQAELMQMTWLSDRELWSIAQSQMTEAEQTMLDDLSRHQNRPDEEKALAALRQQYGQITLRKARAFALLSLRAGKPLLASTR